MWIAKNNISLSTFMFCSGACSIIEMIFFSHFFKKLCSPKIHTLCDHKLASTKNIDFWPQLIFGMLTWKCNKSLFSKGIYVQNHELSNSRLGESFPHALHPHMHRFWWSFLVSSWVFDISTNIEIIWFPKIPLNVPIEKRSRNTVTMPRESFLNTKNKEY